MPLQACIALVDSKLQLLFELWDHDGDGLLAFAEVALAFRKFCPAMQHMQGTAADAVEVIHCSTFSRSFLLQCLCVTDVMPVAPSVAKKGFPLWCPVRQAILCICLVRHQLLHLLPLQPA